MPHFLLSSSFFFLNFNYYFCCWLSDSNSEAHRRLIEGINSHAPLTLLQQTILKAPVIRESQSLMVPFEWLSSPDIVIESIESCFNNAADKKFHVVDFGSGSSLLAIKLLRTHARHVDKVSNLDYNAEALSIALNNMSDDDQINLSQGKIKYHCINLARSFTAEQYEMILKHKNHHACPVLVLDKSTA